MIPFSRPDLSELEVEEVLGVLRTPVLSLGPKVREFEERMAAMLGIRHAIAVSSGTAGLHLAVRAAGLREGEEVLTTPFSFVASANVMLFERALPAFVDVEEETLNLTPVAVEDAIESRYLRTPRGLTSRRSGRRLAGILPVDVFGHPVDIEGLREVADRHGLWLVEDACEALGSEVLLHRRGAWVKAGTHADLAVFAFYPNKQLTTGEGGLIVTNDDELAERCRVGRNQGRAVGSPWLEHAALGYNYRMDELSAALGVGQARRFEELTGRRAAVAAWYAEALKGIRAVRRPAVAPWARVNWFVYVVRLMPGLDRDAVARHLSQRSVETRVYFPPIHLQPLYRDRFGYATGMFPIAESAGRDALALPFFNGLTREQVNAVAAALREGVEAHVARETA